MFKKVKYLNILYLFIDDQGKVDIIFQYILYFGKIVHKLIFLLLLIQYQDIWVKFVRQLLKQANNLFGSSEVHDNGKFLLKPDVLPFVQFVFPWLYKD
ncbi:hypothetical protein ES703_109494 [subsurface metagenome]